MFFRYIELFFDLISGILGYVIALEFFVLLIAVVARWSGGQENIVTDLGPAILLMTFCVFFISYIAYLISMMLNRIFNKTKTGT